jgi:polar amino acid transport system substrate-binding protein
MLRLLGLLIAAAFLMSGTGWAQPMPGCEPMKLKEKYPSLVNKTINVAQDGLEPPFSMRDKNDPNKIVGIDVDLVQETFECLGVPYKINLGAWAGLVPSVAEGRNDIMWDTLYYTPERAKQVDFVLYVRAATGFLVKKGNPKHITSLNDICGDTMGAALGTVEEAAFRDQGKKCVSEGKPDVNLVVTPDVPTGLRQIENDRIDGLMTDLAYVQSIIADDPEKFDEAFRINSGFIKGVAINKGETQLRDAIYETIKLMQKNGKEKEILAKWHTDPSLEYPTEIKTQ